MPRMDPIYFCLYILFTIMDLKINILCILFIWKKAMITKCLNEKSFCTSYFFIIFQDGIMDGLVEKEQKSICWRIMNHAHTLSAKVIESLEFIHYRISAWTKHSVIFVSLRSVVTITLEDANSSLFCIWLATIQLMVILLKMKNCKTLLLHWNRFIWRTELLQNSLLLGHLIQTNWGIFYLLIDFYFEMWHSLIINIIWSFVTVLWLVMFSLFKMKWTMTGFGLFHRQTTKVVWYLKL